jgi:transcriptional regulator with XRE-family HTH domain
MKFNGQALIDARAAAGLTQEQLAVACGATFGTISKLERGVAGEPRLSTITKIAAALDVPVSQLLTESEAVA